MSLYYCNGCSESIPPQKARIHCEVCPDYDSCANCYVIGKYATNHNEDHATHLLETSGYVPPPLAPPVQQRPPVANASYVPHSASPVRSQQPAVQQPAPPANTPRWAPLFDGIRPTPTLVAFLTNTFQVLDTRRAGYLVPEQYSGFLDVLGYKLAEDVWKRNIKPVYGYVPEDIADYELRTILENFGFEFVLQPRVTAPNTDMMDTLGASLSKMLSPAAVKSALTLPSMSGGVMPCLMLKGFIDITVIEALSDPNDGWRYFKTIQQRYGVWSGAGECPRQMLPPVTPREHKELVARVTQISSARTDETLRANAARIAMEQRGQESALRLLDPPGTRYYYSR